MSLGIKRECIGDIYISDNQDAFFACCKEMGDYIVQNFHFVGNVSIELVEIQERIEEVIHYERNVYFVSSLRLDVIIAAAYHLSRKEALDFISNGMVFIKHVLIQNPSHIVKCGDEISVRHKGRFLFEKIGGESKSGRIAVILAKRV